MDKETKEVAVVEGARGLMPVLSVEMAVSRYRQTIKFVEAVFREGVDYGTIPNTNGKTLLKPGAEKICAIFGLTPTFEIIERVEDWTGAEHGGEPFFYYLVRCSLHQGAWLVVSADGSCNSWESRYRWRWVRDDQVPARYRGMELEVAERAVEEFDFAVREGRTDGPYGKPAEYWEGIRRAIADGRAERISKPTRTGKMMEAWRVSTKMVRIPNPDIWELPNTLIKQAEKRALVAAALIAGNLSELFSQDLEDYTYAVEPPPISPVVVEATATMGVSSTAQGSVSPIPPSGPVETSAPTSSKPQTEWDWKALYEPLLKVGISQSEALREFGVSSNAELRNALPWQEALEFRDWLVHSVREAGGLDKLRDALDAEGPLYRQFSPVEDDEQDGGDDGDDALPF